MPPRAVTSEALGPTLGMYSHGMVSPAGEIIVVAGQIKPELLVEIEAMAVKRPPAAPAVTAGRARSAAAAPSRRRSPVTKRS